MDFIDRLNSRLKTLSEAIGSVIPGEYWVDASGFVLDADDGMHEWVAMEHMFDIDSKMYGYATTTAKWEEVPEEERQQYAEELESFKAHEKGGRPATEWALRQGWVRLIGDNADMFGVDDIKLKHLADAIWEIRGDGELEDENDFVFINDVQANKMYRMYVKDLVDEPRLASLRTE